MPGSSDVKHCLTISKSQDTDAVEINALKSNPQSFSATYIYILC